MIGKFFKKFIKMLSNFINKNKRIVTAILSFGFSIFLGLSFYSFNKYDKSWFFYSTDRSIVKNIFGFFGSNVSALFFYLFDAAAYIFIPFFIYISYLLLFKINLRSKIESILSLSLLPFIVAGIMSFKKCSFLGLSCSLCTGYSGCFGGIVGNAIKTICISSLDPYIGLGLLYVLFVMAMILIFRRTTKYTIYFFYKALKFIYSFIFRKEFFENFYKYTKKSVKILISPFVFAYKFCIKLFTGKDFDEKDFSVNSFENYNIDDKSEKDMQDLYVMISRASGKEVSYDSDSDCKKDVYNACRLASDKKCDKIFDQKQEEFEQGNKESLTVKEKKEYKLPELSLFDYFDKKNEDSVKMDELKLSAKVLEEKLEMFGIYGKVSAIKRGPVVTLFEYSPKADSKISKIVALSDDLALALKALSIRIIAPIPGKSFVGFEVSNQKREDVLFSEIVACKDFQQGDQHLPLILGKDTVGAPVVVDLARMPHLLIAGSTGSGKSVALNALLVSLLCKLKPEQLNLILIDPKRLEFSAYEDIAHLVFPIVTDTKKVVPVLKWAVSEMESRYEKMSKLGVKNIQDYNEKISGKEAFDKLPYLVIMVDELADVMMTVGKELEGLITRIAQMARAAGIHMIVATQRPSVDVITGLIKVNFPSRISFRVTSKVDSRTILDCCGAEKLLGRGDMLFLGSGSAFLSRLHGAYVSGAQIERVVAHIKMELAPKYKDLLDYNLKEGDNNIDLDDDLYVDVRDFLNSVDEVSISLLQRKFRIGYNRSARIIEKLESDGLILPSDGQKMRKVVR